MCSCISVTCASNSWRSTFKVLTCQCALLILWYCTIVCINMRCLCMVTLPLCARFTKQLNDAVMSLRPGYCQWCLIKLCEESTIHVSNQDIFSMYITALWEWCVKFNMHNFSNMPIAFIEQTMPTYMHNMPTFMHNMPSCKHNVIMHAHVLYQCTIAVSQHACTTYHPANTC